MSKSDDYCVLIIDEDKGFLESLAEYLQSQNFLTLRAEAADEGMQILREKAPDLTVLGSFKGDSSVAARCRALREMSVAPLVALVDGSENQCLEAFAAGADDCVDRGASVRLLAAHVSAVLRRSNAEPFRTVGSIMHQSGGSHGVLIVGNVRLELTTCRVTIDDVTKTLTPNEFRLMAVFMREPGEVFTREDLRRRVWPDDQHSLHLVEVHIANLRAKIEPDAHHPQYIVTVRSRGYKFSTP